MELSKQDTTAIKGIAICLMLWHHLFLRTVEFGNIAHSLAQVFKVCVALFLFVSGYGLTKQYSKLGKPYFKNTVKFLLKRYVNFFLPYWFCFVLVVLVGNLAGFTFQDAYPASRNTLKCFLLDVCGLMGWESYLTTWWFNKLIIQLYLLFPLLFFVVKNKYTAMLGLVVVVALQLIRPVRLFCLEEGGVPAFFLGMIAAKHQFLPNPTNRRWRILMLTISVALCVGLATLHQTQGMGAYGAVFIRALLALSIVCMYVCIPTSGMALRFVGKYATIMYLTHTLFQQLIPNIIYSLPYSILVFMLFLAISLGVAVLIEWMQRLVKYDKLQIAIVKKVEKW